MRQTLAMAKLLEVIVTSLNEAIEAEFGGADRLELVRDLEAGGLTPDAELVKAVLAQVQIPVRVMLRESPSMSVKDSTEMRSLQAHAEAFSKLPIDGLVTGFIKEGSLDIKAMMDVLNAAPECSVTFHRAFDEVSDPLAAIWQMQGFGQIDRILTIGGTGHWHERKSRLLKWQSAAEPSIRILVAAGLDRNTLEGLRDSPLLNEIHVGRAARVPQSQSGNVSRDAVRALKSALQ